MHLTSRSGISPDMAQPDFDNQQGIGRNEPRNPLFPVGKVGANLYLSVTTWLHADQGLFDARNSASSSQCRLMVDENLIACLPRSIRREPQTNLLFVDGDFVAPIQEHPNVVDDSITLPRRFPSAIHFFEEFYSLCDVV